MDPSRPNEAAYAGIPTFGKLPLVLDPAGLAGIDVAILGAPTDELVSDRPGARFGPRAIRASDPIGWSPPSMPNMDVGADPFEVLNVVDHGDVPTVPGYPLATHDRIRAMVAAVCAAGAIPIVLGGDHSIAHPDAGAVAAHVAPEALGLIHFDAHADDAYEEPRLSHGTPLRLLVEEGSIRGEHIVQIGLRGYWPPPSDFAWARDQGFTWHLMDEIHERGWAVLTHAPPRSPTWRTHLPVGRHRCLRPAHAAGPARPSRAASRRGSCCGRCAASPPRRRWPAWRSWRSRRRTTTPT